MDEKVLVAHPTTMSGVNNEYSRRGGREGRTPNMHILASIVEDSKYVS